MKCGSLSFVCFSATIRVDSDAGTLSMVIAGVDLGILCSTLPRNVPVHLAVSTRDRNCNVTLLSPSQGIASSGVPAVNLPEQIQIPRPVRSANVWLSSIDDPRGSTVSIFEGVTVLGSGELLSLRDSALSGSQAEIHVNGGSVQIIPLTIRLPRIQRGNQATSLQLGKPAPLCNGDILTLVEDQYAYRVTVEDPEASEQVASNVRIRKAQNFDFSGISTVGPSNSEPFRHFPQKKQKFVLR